MKNYGVKVRTWPSDVITALRKVAKEVLEAEAAKDPITRKVHDSFMAFKKKHDGWSDISERPFLAMR